jgi:Protein of unknown function (DUF1592)/Protein of unknown function (DUF1588)/Protein of unknown function (DUF1595)/Protein of unknown function (DUF1587)
MRSRPVRLWAAAAALTAGACSSSASTLEPGDAGNGDAGIVIEAPAPPTGCDLDRPETFVLTNAQYNATVRDLLGDVSSPADGFEPDQEDQRGFVVPQEMPSDAKRAQFEAAADALATTAARQLDNLLPCDPAITGADQCLQQFIASFALRAFRRPPTPDQIASLQAVAQAAPGSLESAAQAVIAAALKSPHFYRIEYELPADRPLALDDYQVAARLSYFIYGSMPDAELFAAAAAGQLHEQPQLLSQARRMMADGKRLSGLAAIVDPWLNLRALLQRAAAPGTPPEQALLYRSMRDETLRFVEGIVFGGGGVRDLLRATGTWVNQAVADVYGVSGISGAEFQPATLDGRVRSGLMTNASLLTLSSLPERTSISHRGTFFFDRFFCQTVPTPAGLAPGAPQPNPGETARQALERAVSATPVCEACHSVIDPFGFALESFDPIGRFRNTLNGLPIDTSGHLKLGSFSSFRDIVELAEDLANESGVSDCVANHWVAAAVPGLWLNNNVFNQPDDCVSQSVRAFFPTKSLQSLIEGVVTSNGFRRHGCSNFSCFPPL